MKISADLEAKPRGIEDSLVKKKKTQDSDF